MIFLNSRIKLILVALLLSTSIVGQISNINISLEPINIPNLGGVHSYAFGQSNGKWLIVGGRLDGLHQRQPFASFSINGNNNQLIVIDPINKQKWTASLTSLPTLMQEQLSSTNPEFYQEGDYLYFLGGYGYSNTFGDHTTFPYLTAINVPAVINAIINNNSFSSFFRQISNSDFQITGGRLKKIDDLFYLMGGQKFIGRYNPMGPNHGPGFIQEYTNSIKVFSLQDDGTNITINNIKTYTDTINLHRRDYNAESQIMPNGEQGLTMFSGVFQYAADLPFLNSVDIDTSGYTVNNSFQQYYNHYHCAVVPLYSESENKMHTIFFGGIAQYYENNGTRIQDNNVPFVNTIAEVTRNSQNVMTELKLVKEMPALLGAGAEFIPNRNLAHYSNEVFKLDSITDDSTLLGYIYGGISSTQANIFFINTGTQSSANSQIYKVYYVNKPVSTKSIIKDNELKIRMFPNPTNGVLVINYSLDKVEDVKISIYDIKGQLIDNIVINNQAKGEHFYKKDVSKFAKTTYLVNIETTSKKSSKKIIIN
jgi:hypothetical protein